MSGRRQRGKENIRSLNKVSNGKSYSVTIPIEMIRALGWEKRQKLELSMNPKTARISITDWPRKK